MKWITIGGKNVNIARAISFVFEPAQEAPSEKKGNPDSKDYNFVYAKKKVLSTPSVLTIDFGEGKPMCFEGNDAEEGHKLLLELLK